MSEESGTLDPFAVVFDLKGTALQGLRELGYGLKEIISLQKIVIDNFSKMNLDPKLSLPLHDVNKELDNMKDNTKEGMLALKELGDMLKSSFEETMQSIIDIGYEAINVGSEVEASRKKLAFSANKAGIDVEEQMKRLDLAGLKTTQTTKQLYDMANTLNMQKIDIFDKTLEDLNYIDKAGRKISLTSAEVLADAASLSARGPEAFMAGLRGALGDGKIKKNIGLDAILDLPENFRKRYNTALAKGITQQEKFNNLVKELAKDFGGTASSLGDSYKFMINQVDDFKDKIYYELVKDILPRLSAMIKQAGDYILKFMDSGKLEPIRKAVFDIYLRMEKVVKILAKAVAWTAELVSKHPGLLKVGFAILTIGLASISAFAAVSRLGIAVQGATVLLETMKKAMLWFKTGGLGKALAPLAPILLKLGIIAAAVAFLARILVKGKSWADTWERVQLVFDGISEGITSMNNGVSQLSLDTASKLKRTGLFEFVYNFLRIANRVGKFVDGVFRGFSQYGPKIYESIIRIRDAISRIITRILGDVGTVTKVMGFEMKGAADTGIQGWIDFGEKFGILVGFLIEKLVELVEIAVDIAEIISTILTPILATIDFVKSTKGSILESPEFKAKLIEAHGEEAVMKYQESLKPKSVTADALDALIAKKDKTGETAPQNTNLDYDKMRMAIIDGMRAAGPPEVYMSGAKVTDAVATEVVKRRDLKK